MQSRSPSDVKRMIAEENYIAVEESFLEEFFLEEFFLMPHSIFMKFWCKNEIMGAWRKRKCINVFLLPFYLSPKMEGRKQESRDVQTSLWMTSPSMTSTETWHCESVIPDSPRWERGRAVEVSSLESNCHMLSSVARAWHKATEDAVRFGRWSLSLGVRVGCGCGVWVEWGWGGWVWLQLLGRKVFHSFRSIFCNLFRPTSKNHEGIEKFNSKRPTDNRNRDIIETGLKTIIPP